MSEKKGWSEEKTDFFGNKYTQHYDEHGNKTGWSEERTGFLGDKYTQHHDQSGDKTGWSEKRTGLFGDKYTQHYDRGPAGIGAPQDEPENSRHSGSSSRTSPFQGSSSSYSSSSNSTASPSSGPSIPGVVGFIVVLGIVAVFIYNALSPTPSSQRKTAREVDSSSPTRPGSNAGSTSTLQRRLPGPPRLGTTTARLEATSSPLSRMPLRKELSAAKWFNAVVLGPTGGHVATSDNDGTVTIWDTTTGRPLRVLQALVTDGSALAFDRTGALIAAGGSDGAARVWSLDSGKLTNTLRGHHGPVTAAAFAPDKPILASGGRDRTISLWQLRDGMQLASIIGHSDPIWALAFSPDGTLLASGSGGAFDYTARVWRLIDREAVHIFDVGGIVYALSFSLDGKRLAVAGWDQISIWNVVTGEWLLTLPWQSKHQPVTQLGFSPSGELLASSHGEGVVRIWETGSGRLIDTLHFEKDSGPPPSVLFNADGQTLLGVREAVATWKLRKPKSNAFQGTAQ